VIDEGVRLTMVGMGTAFALLLLLTLVVTLMGAAFRWVAGRGVAREDPAARDRAVAAAVAVGVMRARSPGDGRSA
jgi:Na+-transporting methylmalonyl-CoA/oxaloacetate decarboxylase gamma subunit